MENLKKDSNEPVKGEAVENDREHKKKDGWDKAAILFKPVGGLLTALTIAYIGFMSNEYLASRQQNELRTRLYTEIISQREESESALRKDMFTCIIGSFLEPESATLKENVLKLELLVYNFHESFNLKPLFKHIMKQIDNETTDIKKGEFKKRVKKAAKEITSKQLAILDNAAEIKLYTIDVDSKEWMVNGTEDNTSQSQGDTLELEEINRVFILEVESIDTANKEIIFRMEISRKFEKFKTVKISHATIKTDKGNEFHKIETTEIDVRAIFPLKGEGIYVKQDEGHLGLEKVVSVETSEDTITYPVEIEKNTATFSVGFFDFPMIDNTRLSHDQRCAIVLKEFDSSTVDIALVYFPGSYASLKDKPYYQDVVDNLLNYQSDKK